MLAIALLAQSPRQEPALIVYAAGGPEPPRVGSSALLENTKTHAGRCPAWVFRYRCCSPALERARCLMEASGASGGGDSSGGAWPYDGPRGGRRHGGNAWRSARTWWLPLASGRRSGKGQRGWPRAIEGLGAHFGVGKASSTEHTARPIVLERGRARALACEDEERARFGGRVFVSSPLCLGSAFPPRGR